MVLFQLDFLTSYNFVIVVYLKLQSFEFTIYCIIYFEVCSVRPHILNLKVKVFSLVISEENNLTEWDYGFICGSPGYLEKLGGNKLFTLTVDVLSSYLM